MASFIYRNTAGAEQNAFLTVATASIAAGQVRFVNPARTSLSTARNVALHPANSVYGSRFSQLDLAVRKTLIAGPARLQLALDVYNALNGNSTQNVITAYSLAGNRWLRPSTFLDARLARITANLQF
jgi:hypothetical protein